MRELMSVWKDHLYSFYEYKKLSGYSYEKEESPIYMFDRYYAQLGIQELKFTRDIIEPFLYLKEGERVSNQNFKATTLRQFGKYLFINNIIDDIYIIPPISLKGEKEYIPYIYSEDELKSIVNYLEKYQTPMIPGGFRQKVNLMNSLIIVYKILISTGMRLNEVLNLKRNNVDLVNNLIIIEKAKNNNKRIVPVSNTLSDSIKIYITNTPFYIGYNDLLFQIEEGNQLNRSHVTYYLYKAFKALDIPHQKGKGPRIHDFRHTFAVMSLTQMQSTEDDINSSLSYLSAYLGHKSIRETQKYIWLTPSLFKDTKLKMEQYSSFIMDIFEGEKYDED